MVESDALGTRPVSHAFVGRAGELAELRAALDEVQTGRGRLFLLVGEAGIGKTRLSEEVAAAASRQGALVVWGRCWEGGGAPAFWPWVQIFRALAAGLEDRVLRQTLGDATAQIASLAPEMAARVGVAARAVHASALESEFERFPLFDAVSGFLKRLGARQPLVLVLDDLHAADEPSLLLLEFLGRELITAPLLVIGNYREVEAHRDPERARLLGSVARCGHRLPLRGLSLQEVERLVSDAMPAAGAWPGVSLAELTARVFQITEGNPFFVDEVVRLLRADPASAAAAEPLIPRGIREAVRGQLRPLSPPCRRLVAAAAVIGHEFDLTLLQELVADEADAAAGTILDLLGEAEAAGVVARQAGTLARYAFCHALIRDTLYEDLGAGQRARLHWHAAEVLERQSTGDADAGGRSLAEIANHFLRGAAVGDARKAASYAARAGERAAALLAYEEAAACYQQALEALALSGEGDEIRVELLLSLGEMQARAWNTTSAQETFRKAAELARSLSPDHSVRTGRWLARAALGCGGAGIGVPRGHLADEALVRLLQGALDALGESEPSLRARVLARLAVELYFSDSAARRAALCDEAAELARRSGDVSTLAYVVMAQHFAIWDSPDIDWRLSIANEGVELAQRAGEPDFEFVSRLWRILDLLEKGEVSRWEAELDEIERVAVALRQPRPISFAATLRAMRALWLGRFDEAEAFWLKGLEVAARTQDGAATINVAVQRFALQRARGEQAQQLPLADAALERLRAEPTVRCMRALLHADLGNVEQARQDFERLAEVDFADLHRSNVLGSAQLPWLSEVCAFLHDVPRAAVLYELLLPYARQNIAGGPRLFFGPAAQWLGLLAAVGGRLDEAVDHLEDAIERSRAMKGAPTTASTQYQLARVLHQRDDAGDRERAKDLLILAEDTANTLGLSHLAGLVRRLAEEIERTPERERVRAAAAAEGSRQGGQIGGSGAATPSARAAASGGRVLRFPAKGQERPRPELAAATSDRKLEYVFHREGEFWTVSDGTAVLRLKDTKGLRYIAQLLQHPDREIHVMDLIAPERDAGAEEGASLARASEEQLHDLGMHSTADAQSADRLLDSRARAAYRRRLEDLREEIDEATRFNDTERASRARAEMDFLASELARAIGLGGRDRASASGAERARLNVSRAIKAVLRRITSGNANLGRYLETTLHTGAFCSYKPDPRLKVTWRL